MLNCQNEVSLFLHEKRMHLAQSGHAGETVELGEFPEKYTAGHGGNGIHKGNVQIFSFRFLLSHGAESDQHRPDIGAGFRDQHSQGGDCVRKEDNGNIARKAQHHRSTVFVKAAVLAAMQKPTG